MVPGVAGRRSSAAGPAGPRRIAHCTGQHRRPQLLDAVTPTPNPTYERGRRGTQLWRPPAERRWSVSSRRFCGQHCSGSSACALNPFRYTCDKVSLRPVETRKGVSCRLAVTEPIPRGVGRMASPHLREPRILRPADRPGRPPFLRPVGADQSRDEVRAASWERSEQRYPPGQRQRGAAAAALKAPRALPPAARVLTGPGRVKALRFAPPSRCAGLDPTRTGQGSSAYEEALGVVRTGENTDPAGGSVLAVLAVLAVRESSATATPPWNRQRDCQPQRHGAGPRR